MPVFAGMTAREMAALLRLQSRCFHYLLGDGAILLQEFREILRRVEHRVEAGFDQAFLPERRVSTDAGDLVAQLVDDGRWRALGRDDADRRA